jgi:hypothetical protein
MSDSFYASLVGQRMMEISRRIDELVAALDRIIEHQNLLIENQHKIAAMVQKLLPQEFSIDLTNS